MEVLPQPKAHILEMGTFTKEGWPLLWIFCSHYPIVETDDAGALTNIFGWRPDELRELWLYLRRN